MAYAGIAGVWAWSALLFWTIFLVLYTTFFSNPAGAYTVIFGALLYWVDQQGVAQGGQPWFYYLVLLPMYEFLAAAWFWFRSPTGCVSARFSRPSCSTGSRRACSLGLGVGEDALDGDRDDVAVPFSWRR